MGDECQPCRPHLGKRPGGVCHRLSFVRSHDLSVVITTLCRMTTTRVTETEIEELIRRFDALDMGEWDRAAVERAAAQLGWQVHPHRGCFGEWLDLHAPLSAGSGSAYPDTTSEPQRPDGYHFLLPAGGNRLG